MQNERIIDSAQANGVRIDIVEMTRLDGAKNGSIAQYLPLGISVKQPQSGHTKP